MRYVAIFLMTAAIAAASGAAEESPQPPSPQPVSPQPIEAVEPIDAQAQFDTFDEHIPGNNVTADYRERFAHIDQYLTDERKDTLKQYNIMLVHGLMGEVGLKFTNLLNSFDKNQTLIAYLKDQKRALEQCGIEPEFASFKSASIDRSGTKIAEAIAKSDRPVVIVSHSKGGIDTLDALIKLQKKGLLGKVAGWVSIQGCFYGTPDADKYENNKIKQTLVHITVKCLGANWDAVKDLTTTAGEAYQAKHREEVADVLSHVPTLCFASWLDKERFGEKSDGQVPPHSAILPNTDYIAKFGVSHEMTVIKSSEEFDRVTFTQVLMTMIADRLGKPGSTAPVPAHDTIVPAGVVVPASASSSDKAKAVPPIPLATEALPVPPPKPEPPSAPGLDTTSATFEFVGAPASRP